MRFKITFTLICLEALLFCCTVKTKPLKFLYVKNGTIFEVTVVGNKISQKPFDNDFPEAYPNSTLHYGHTTFEHKNNSLEDLITEIDEEVEQPFDETELLHHSMEEETNFLDIIAQKVAGLHPNSSVERYDRVCGGVLEPSESGVIRYKVNEEYASYEHCAWLIEVPGATRIEFILEKNGFPVHNYSIASPLAITSVYDHDTSVMETGQKLRLSNDERSGFITGSRALVRFTRYTGRLGKGFRLRFQKRIDFHTTNESEGSKCGGVIVGQTGYLNYKLGKDYLNNERCVWLLHSPGSKRIQLQLTDDEFNICCDYLSVNTIDPETGVIRNDTKIFNARNWNQTIEAPLLVILFHSDDSKSGKGFSLKFNSSGNQLNVKYKYKLQHITGRFGTPEYLREQIKWEGSVRGEQEIFVIASSRITILDKYYTVIDWKTQQPNGSSLPPSLAIYEPLTQNEVGTHIPPVWVQKEKFRKCKESDCPIANRMSTQYNEKLVKTIYVEEPAFIIVYKSFFDGRNGTETRLTFDYSRKLKEDTCGGLLEPLQSEYGFISYKENEVYNNLEKCIWTIDVPGAAGIYFKVEISGLDFCCDHLNVASIDTVGSMVELSSDERQTIVTGPRAKVTFTSDDFTMGMGFRLHYEGVTVLPMDVCGGIVKPTEGDFGVITYKENLTYANNESCVWLIELLNASLIEFTLEKGGFQTCCDYITVGLVDDEWNESLTGALSKLRSKGDTAVVLGQKAIVRFSSDTLKGGTGFRLGFKKLSDRITGGEGVCGGILEPSESGVIRYKVNEEYDDYKDCAWIIDVPGATKIYFILEENSFHGYDDYITITFLYDRNTPVLERDPKLRLSNIEPTGFVRGSRAMVRFTSDHSITGTGFRLRFHKELDFDTGFEPEGSKCGGVIVGQKGYLNYKLGKDYLNNEGCVWLLHSPGSESIVLLLVDDGFEIGWDWISVNSIDPETGVLRNDTKLFNEHNWNHTIEASLLVILFHSDKLQPGKGFFLQFHSSGNQLNVKYKYKLQHLTAMFGSTEYPSEQAKWEGSESGEQDIFVIASSRITISDKYYTVIDWKVQPPNDSCLQHSLVIYKPLTEDEVGMHVPTIWVQKEQFPKSNVAGCSHVNTMPTKYSEKFKQTFIVAAPVFIIVYTSLFDGYNGTETRFKFDYSRKRNPSQISKLLGTLVEPEPWLTTICTY